MSPHATCRIASPSASQGPSTITGAGEELPGIDLDSPQRRSSRSGCTARRSGAPHMTPGAPPPQHRPVPPPARGRSSRAGLRRPT
eukprot:CAMPEP_0182884068 /NCGR_PEP_ID=MMETSP0034_2-20130328/18766_1 /TAXON_ID=156128 /ORGANISM="Nephroselmis pyriformis, Strain CCMP717" /LENGTH=84 /DNA_ID=CAMNT_0025017239 /DNA_START=42 /DNA_END=294 /DNA_ORIENTATION=+